MALPRSLKEFNERTTKAGEDLLEFYSQLRRGGAPRSGSFTEDDSEPRGLLPTMELVTVEVPGSPTKSIARSFAEVKRPARTEVNTMTPQEALEIVVNEPAIRITPELMDVINDPSMMMTRGGELTRRISSPMSRAFESQNTLPKKKKRKVSKYQKEFGIQLKKLKKKFPRTKIQNLMKRAHAATRKALKKK